MHVSTSFHGRICIAITIIYIRRTTTTTTTTTLLLLGQLQFRKAFHVSVRVRIICIYIAITGLSTLSTYKTFNFGISVSLISISKCTSTVLCTATYISVAVDTRSTQVTPGT